MEIPLNIIFISPVFDLLIFFLISYYFIFKYIYLDLLNDRKVDRISSLDFKFSLFSFIWGYLNYKGKDFEIFSLNISWWAALPMIQILVSFFYIKFIYKKEWNKFKKIIDEEIEREKKKF